MAFKLYHAKRFLLLGVSPLFTGPSGCKNEKGGDLAKRHVTGFSKPVKEQDILKGVYKDPCKHDL